MKREKKEMYFLKFGNKFIGKEIKQMRKFIPVFLFLAMGVFLWQGSAQATSVLINGEENVFHFHGGSELLDENGDPVDGRKAEAGDFIESYDSLDHVEPSGWTSDDVEELTSYTYGLEFKHDATTGINYYDWSAAYLEIYLDDSPNFPDAGDIVAGSTDPDVLKAAATDGDLWMKAEFTAYYSSWPGYTQGSVFGLLNITENNTGSEWLGAQYTWDESGMGIDINDDGDTDDIYTGDLSVACTLSGLGGNAFGDYIEFTDSNPLRGHPVPEPTTMLLLGSGLIGMAGFGRKKLKK